jgi:hypothetical protein
MFINRISTALALAVVPAVAVAADRPPAPFEAATIYVEQNATDRDTEVVIAGTAGDEGLALLRITSPDGRLIARLRSPDPTTLGMREFHFESPEPPGEAVLAAYPEGEYLLWGESVTGKRFRTVLRLSHQLPPAVTILEPADEAEVPVGAVTVRWSAATGIRGFILEIENESADPERALVIDLPRGATSFRIPSAFIRPGGEYQVGVHTVKSNGNIVAVESTFTVEE